MKVQIKNRKHIEKMVFTEKIAVISITDANWTFAEFKNKPAYLLQLAFDDVDNDIFIDEPHLSKEEVESKYHMITDEQAKQIAEFYNQVRHNVDVLICQCEHGQSRSAAIAAAILEHKSKKGIEVFANDKYYPNKAVFNKVLKQLRLLG